VYWLEKNGRLNRPRWTPRPFILVREARHPVGPLRAAARARSPHRAASRARTDGQRCDTSSRGVPWPSGNTSGAALDQVLTSRASAAAVAGECTCGGSQRSCSWRLPWPLPKIRRRRPRRSPGNGHGHVEEAAPACRAGGVAGLGDGALPGPIDRPDRRQAGPCVPRALPRRSAPARGLTAASRYWTNNSSIRIAGCPTYPPSMRHALRAAMGGEGL